MLEINKFVIKGDYKQALKEIDNVSIEESLESKILKCRLLERMRDLENALLLSKEILKEVQFKGTLLQQLQMNINQCFIYLARFEFQNLGLEIKKLIRKNFKLLFTI